LNIVIIMIVYMCFFFVFGYLCFGDTYLLEVMLSK